MGNQGNQRYDIRALREDAGSADADCAADRECDGDVQWDSAERWRLAVHALRDAYAAIRSEFAAVLTTLLAVATATDADRAAPNADAARALEALAGRLHGLLHVCLTASRLTTSPVSAALGG